MWMKVRKRGSRDLVWSIATVLLHFGILSRNISASEDRLKIAPLREWLPRYSWYFWPRYSSVKIIRVFYARRLTWRSVEEKNFEDILFVSPFLCDMMAKTEKIEDGVYVRLSGIICKTHEARAFHNFLSNSFANCFFFFRNKVAILTRLSNWTVSILTKIFHPIMRQQRIPINNKSILKVQCVLHTSRQINENIVITQSHTK